MYATRSPECTGSEEGGAWEGLGRRGKGSASEVQSDGKARKERKEGKRKSSEGWGRGARGTQEMGNRVKCDPSGR